MKAAVIGTGNVGWALASLLARSPHIERVYIAGRSIERTRGLLMDICSATPQARDKVTLAKLEELTDADIVILTSGAQMKPGETATDVRANNIRITDSILRQLTLQPSAILITIATPVDDITIYAQLVTKLPSHQVFGFGGDLDHNRLLYVLGERDLLSGSVELVGEHGAQAIPVYAGEREYPTVAREVRGFLRTVTSLAGETRNLSTAILLSRLIDSISLNSGTIHYVCGFHPQYNVYLTWGFPVGRMGLGIPSEIAVTGAALHDLNELIDKRQAMTAHLLSLDL